jgi:hypothetical protein
MNLLTISAELRQLLELVGEWKNSNKIPDIEREIALDRLKLVYAQLKNIASSPVDNFVAGGQQKGASAAASSNSLQGVFYEIQEEVSERLEPIPTFGSHPSSDIEELVIPDFSILSGRVKEAEEQPSRLTVEEAAPILKSISSIADAINSNARLAEAKPAPAADKRQEVAVEKRAWQAAEPASATERVAPSPRVEEAKPSAAPEVRRPEPAAPASPRRKAEPASKPQGKPVEDLRKAISFNDKFYLIKELFRGDALAYETAITKLNTFESLDEALIYIQESYRWDASSTAAQLIVDLLQRRFI